MFDKYGACVKVVDIGLPEETTNGVVVEIHREYTAGTERLERHRKDARGYRFARLRFPVLSRVAHVWNDRRYLVSRCAARCIDGEEETYPCVRRTRRLYEKYIFTAQIFFELHVLLAVREGLALDSAECRPRLVGNMLRESVIAAQTEYAEIHCDEYNRSRKAANTRHSSCLPLYFIY